MVQLLQEKGRIARKLSVHLVSFFKLKDRVIVFGCKAPRVRCHAGYIEVAFIHQKKPVELWPDNGFSDLRRAAGVHDAR